MQNLRRSNHWIFLCLIFLATCSGLRAELKLAELFGDNMMLQRDALAAVWGTSDPGDTITLTLGDQKATATADAAGNWKAVFQGLKANSSQDMTVAGKANSITVKNVAVGDIWVCSGQSNMEFRLYDKDDLAAANLPDIRYCYVIHTAVADPASSVKGNWTVCSPKTANIYSAAAFYFARNIQPQVGVPIGLIGCPWSGISIEPFIPLEQLETVPGLKEKSDTAMQKLKSYPADVEKFPADYKAWLEKYGRVDTDNKGFAAKWADPTFDTKDWIKTPFPNDWSKVGAPNGGVIWVRKTVQILPDAVGKDFKLNLGVIHDTDTAYFNGEQIGTGGANPPSFWNESRNYLVPGRLVKAGDNVVAVRIVSQRQRNSTFNRGAQVFPHVVDPATWTDDWLAKVETEYPPLPDDALKELPAPPFANPALTPSAIFNGTINPLTSYGIKGALWYQGESNSGNPWAYRTLLPLLIKGWRDKWNIGDFPFYIVQLPNFGIPPTAPNQGDMSWAELREAQFLATKKEPNTGISVSIDIGDGRYLHPPDKKDVGYRLSLIALEKTYGQKIESSGPVYESMAVEGNKIRLKFAHIGGGLVAKDGPLKQFIICGEDKKWAAADAVIDGDTVVVSSSTVATPTTVRYAWAADPEGCNLYNKAGLPAMPFRTDDWPLASENKW